MISVREWPFELVGGNPQSASFYPFPDNAPQLIVVDLHKVDNELDEEVDKEVDKEVDMEMAASLYCFPLVANLHCAISEYHKFPSFSPQFFLFLMARF